MPEDTKTYWQFPGETGLPTELDFTGSEGLVTHEVIWPYPQRDRNQRYANYVYYGPTLLPVELKLNGETARLDVSVVMGVCSEICVPAQARFSLSVDGAKDMPNGLRIRQAVAMAPIAWDAGEEPIGAVQYRPADRVLAVWVNDADIDPASLIAASATGEAVFGAPQKSPEPNLVLIPVLGKSDEIDLENRPVQLTFTTGMGAYELTRSVTLAN
jgi:DsbC/DsbD-like thiol-disulfide interchange protein